MRSYGEQFESGTTVVFDRSTLQLVGLIPNTQRASAKVTAWQDFVFLTQPGCCGPGIDIYDGATLKRVQFINRFTTNTVAGIKRKGVPLLIGGTESGTVDLYRQNNNGYEYLSSADLHSLTGFNGPEDIEIRALWADGLDNLVFAASSWGNDSTRGPSLPSLFILEIR
jgi:hypothetical protein